MKAAIIASEENLDILLIAKNPIARGGITTVGFTGLSANIGQEARDRAEIHFRDTVEAGRYLSDQNLVEAMVREESRIFGDLIRYGIEFEREKGNFVQVLTPGQTYPRMLRLMGGGHRLVLGLKREMERHRNIEVIN